MTSNRDAPPTAVLTRSAEEERRFLRQTRWGHAVIPLGAAGFARHLWPSTPTPVVLVWLGLVAFNLLLGLIMLTYDLRRFEATTQRARSIRIAIACGSFAVIWGALAPMTAFLGDRAELPWIVNSIMGMVALQLLVASASRALFNVALIGLTAPSAVTLVLIGRADRFAMLLLWTALMVGLNLSRTAGQRRLQQMTLANAELADALRDERDRLAAAHDHLSYQADHDPLTGLINRRAATTHLEAALAGTYRPAVVYVDLDLFKPVNDRLGHEVGDQLLGAVADRLALRLRPEDCAARWGGDEFVLLLAGPIDTADAAAVADRVVTELSQPFTIGSHTVQIGASAGIAVAQPGEDTDPLLNRADRALAQAKAAGRRCVVVDDPDAAGGRAAGGDRRPMGWTVLDLLSDPVIVLTDDLAVAHVNPAAERLLGICAATVQGCPLDDLVHPDDRSLLTLAPAAAAIPPVVARFRTPTGSWRPWTVQHSDGTDHAAVRGTVLVGRPLPEGFSPSGGTSAAAAR